MRAGAAVLALLALAACQQEPTFDERFDTAHDKIEGMARDIDGELKASLPSEETPAADPARDEAQPKPVE